MALTSDSQSSTNGANVVEHESAGIISGDDLEDGEIFEDEVAETESEAKPKSAEEVTAETILSNIRNSKPLLPTPKLYNEVDKTSKDKGLESSDKKRRKRHSRDEDEEGEEEKKRRKENKKHFPEHDRKRELELLEKLEAAYAEREDDMIFARGASPMRHEDDIDRWEGDEDDEEDDHRQRNVRSRGMGRRDHTGRGKRRGGRGGSSIPRKRKRDDHENVCIFYMHGKCHRGSECPYSHDGHPPRKMELCKFYMMDCCAKKDKCLYMHNDFPCKYYHTGLKCYAGKNCKFSHGKLNETLRKILLKHLETAPKEILGEFPRMTREGAMTMMHGRNEKKIPSLFDIKVPKPANLCNNSNSDGSHTPMPSPTHQSQDSRTSDREYTPEKERDKEREKEKEIDREKGREERKERRSREKQDRKKEKEKKRERKREHRKEREKESGKEKSKERHLSEEELESKKLPPILSDEPSKEKDKEKEKEKEYDKESEIVTGPSTSLEENLETVPAHLPKKQRELFLRIQQQQREANSSQTSGEDDDHDDGDARGEENWYSSDEEGTPTSTLPSILRNLTQGTNQPLPATSTIAAPVSTAPILPPIISNIDFSSVFKVLSSIQNLDQKKNEPSYTSPVLNEDIPLKPSSPPEPSTAAKKVDLFSLLNADKKTDLIGFLNSSIQKPQEPPRARDPRLRNDGAGGDTLVPTVAPLVDIDLRLKSSKPRSIGGGDVDLRNLPFKPAPVHSAANEIDASLSSHSPIVYRLIPVETAKTDYTSLQALAKPGVNDPRLRRAVRIGPEETACRDPRQRLGLIDDSTRPKTTSTSVSADPRQRVLLLQQPNLPVLPTPSTPRYDEDHRTPYFRSLDSDMRQFPPPTPRIDDDYVPNTIRSSDPRQRNSTHNFDVDPRRPGYMPPRHFSADTDLRPQLGLQQSQYNIK